MKLLLDTHIALWATLQTRGLSKQASALIADPANEIFVSAVSVWEIAIKYARRRGKAGDMPLSGSEALSIFGEAGYVMLPVSAGHAATVDGLPGLHSDPFDRLLVAQAISEPMRLLTSDTQLAEYGAMVVAV